MSTTSEARVVLIGGGPRSLMLLERLTAHAGERTGLNVTVLDPYPPAAGRIWRTGQSPYLQLNSMAADVSIFNDDSCVLGAPSLGGPALDVWVEGLRSGEFAPPWVPDAVTAEEIRTLGGSDFPSRRLNSLYLEWARQRLLATLPSNVNLDFVTDTVHSVENHDGVHTVYTASGTTFDADAVVYLVGHTDGSSSTETASLRARSSQAGLTYHGPAYTADDDHHDLEPGENVIVRGLGLAAIDLIVMLTLGRGGRFEVLEEDRFLPASRQRLRYQASGLEPRLLLGSRRGVPYRSKSLQTLDHAPAPLEVLSPAYLAEAASRGAALDLEEDLFPLIRTELSLAHHRELFQQYPDRVLSTWDTTRTAILALEESSPELDAYLAQLIPDPRDRFSVAAWDRPLTGLAVASLNDLDQVIADHIREDLYVHLDPAFTPTLAVFHALLQIHVVLADAPPTSLSERTHEHGLPEIWQGFFSYFASGPPPERLHQLLALADAGVLGFLGPQVRVDVVGEGTQARFRAQSPAVAEAAYATALVDAWLPANDATRSSNPALTDLAQRAGLAGIRIHVDPAGAVLDPHGTRLPTTWALGAPTSSPDAGAFARPNTNALPFRTTDTTAADILTTLFDSPENRLLDPALDKEKA